MSDTTKEQQAIADQFRLTAALVERGHVEHALQVGTRALQALQLARWLAKQSAA